jgi:hypothetical protein
MRGGNLFSFNFMTIIEYSTLLVMSYEWCLHLWIMSFYGYIPPYHHELCSCSLCVRFSISLAYYIL